MMLSLFDDKNFDKLDPPFTKLDPNPFADKTNFSAGIIAFTEFLITPSLCFINAIPTCSSGNSLNNSFNLSFFKISNIKFIK